MKKVFATVSLILAIFILAGCSQAAVSGTTAPTPTAAPTPTPNKADLFMLPDWVVFGMSESDVKSHYKINGMIISSSITYYYPYRDYDKSDFYYGETYQFDSGKLYNVGFIVQFMESLKTNYEEVAQKPIHEEYENIKLILSSKFGKPDNDMVKWNNNTYKKDSTKLNYAIVLGYVEYKTEWYYNNYHIKLYNGSLGIYVTYTIKE